MYLVPIISQYLDILHQSQRLGIVFFQMVSWNQGAVHKEWHYQNVWVIHLRSVMVRGIRKSLVD